jgi:hypothetical protein
MAWGYNKANRDKDRAEDIVFRRDAAAILKQAQVLIEKSKKKLVGVKGVSVSHEINTILYDLKEAIETLEDSQNDPD